jgi:hypothetical protein
MSHSHETFNTFAIAIISSTEKSFGERILLLIVLSDIVGIRRTTDF